MLPDLFQPQEIELVTPEGQSEPRLWVRRLAVWQDASTKLRDISFRPGMNIVWSPDLETNNAGATPHGSGKSTLIRLIRYCLGEQHFANEQQRMLMASRFPEGFVGAEVIIDGTCWVVTRPIGMNVPFRAEPANKIEDSFERLLASAEHETLSGIVSDAFFSPFRDKVPAEVGPEKLWDAILPWLSRDQECRLDDIFHWRSDSSQSGSIAHGLGKPSKLTIIRLAIRALSSNELGAQANIRRLTQDREMLKRKLERLNWQLERMFEDVANSLGVSADRDPNDEASRREIIDRARENVAHATGRKHQPATDMSDDLTTRRRDLFAKRKETGSRVERARSLLETLPVQISALRAEQGTEQATLDTGVVRRCPICRTDIDTILAKGCGISLQRCDLDAVRARLNEAENKIRGLEGQQQNVPSEIAKLENELSGIDKELETLDQEYARREQALTQHEGIIAKARQLVRDAERLDESAKEFDQDRKALSDIENRIDGLRDTADLERSKAAALVSLLNERYRQIVAGLMPEGVEGKVRLDGKGLHPEITYGSASVTTAAVESFKIIAFDLAALLLAVEEKADLPAFLIHDSPREADLDGTIYGNLFRLMQKLEGDQPLFQYIVTTTTSPPPDLTNDPWLRLTIRGSPAEERLLGVDL